MAVPKLRFKADDGSDYPGLEETKLDTLMAFKNGINASGDKFGRGTKCISVMDILNNSCITYDVIKGEVDVDEKILQNFTVENGDAVFQRSSENVQDAGRANVYMDKDRPATFSGFEIRGKRIANYEPMFMNGLLNTFSVRKQIMSKAQGAQHINIGQEILSSVRVNMPSLPEQQKIAEFLSTIDTVIEKQKETVSAWEERKKGVMQKLFSQKVRFKADDGSDFPEWKEHEITELIQLYNEKVSSDCQLPILTSSKKNGIEYQEEHFAGKQRHDIEGYNVLPRNYCTYRNRSDGTDFTFNINKLCDKGIVSKFYPVFKENDCDLFFLVSLLNNERKTVRKIAYTAKGTGQKVLSITDLRNITVDMPSLPEQQKISDCLSSLDDVIAKQKATLAAWEEMKKGLLQQMFV